MSDNFNRRYALTIQTNELFTYIYEDSIYPSLGFPNNLVKVPIAVESNYITIKNPFTIDFSINRNADASSNNTLTIDIYNLSEKTRNLIFQDIWPNVKYSQQRPSISFVAGYETLYNVFLGNVIKCTSLRKGADIITRLEAFDGQEAVGMFSQKTYGTEVTKQEVLDSLINDFSIIKRGTVYTVPGTFPRGVTLQGNTFDLISRYTNKKCFIDLNTINLVTYNQYIPSIENAAQAGMLTLNASTETDIPVINVDTGLLDIPQREESTIKVHTMFAPFLKIGQLIELKSLYQKQYNGRFKVIGITHQGIISDAIGGTCTTYIQLQYSFNEAQNVYRSY